MAVGNFLHVASRGGVRVSKRLGLGPNSDFHDIPKPLRILSVLGFIERQDVVEVSRSKGFVQSGSLGRLG